MSVTCVKQTIHHCEEDPGWDPACLDGGGDRDGSTDAGADAQDGSGTFCPARPCDGALVCDAVEGRCVPCLAASNEGCGDGAPVCVGAGADAHCVECGTAQDCEAPPSGRAYCGDNNMCGCHDDGECEAAGLGSSCVGEACVDCDDDLDCGANRTCATLSHMCSDVAPGTVSGCEACDSDSQCDNPGGVQMSCVAIFFSQAEVGAYCARPALDGQCTAPYSPRMATSLGGNEASYCLPIEEVTCEAVLDFNEPCADDVDCGKEGLADAACVDELDKSKRCTYRCSSGADCPGEVTCSPSTNPPHCQTR